MRGGAEVAVRGGLDREEGLDHVFEAGWEGEAGGSALAGLGERGGWGESTVDGVEGCGRHRWGVEGVVGLWRGGSGMGS